MRQLLNRFVVSGMQVIIRQVEKEIVKEKFNSDIIQLLEETRKIMEDRILEELDNTDHFEN